MKLHQSLWQQLFSHLASGGWIVTGGLNQTPVEIAMKFAHEKKDIRMLSFVWSYYYPLAFGNQSGTMTDKEAQALVEAIKTAFPPKDAKPSRAEHSNAFFDFKKMKPTSLQPMCAVCNTRPLTQGVVK